MKRLPDEFTDNIHYMLDSKTSAFERTVLDILVYKNKTKHIPETKKKFCSTKDWNALLMPKIEE